MIFRISLLVFLCLPCHDGLSKDYDLLLADHTQKMLLIRTSAGEIIWKHPGKSLYEAWMQDDGSVVYCTDRTVQMIVPDLNAGRSGKVVWTYEYGNSSTSKPLPKGTIYTCIPIRGGDNYLVTEPGTYRLVELDRDGQIVHRINLPHPKIDSTR